MNKVKVLIVEDEQLMALDLKEKLEEMGFIVTAITDTAEQTITSIEQERPDLIIMDIVIDGNVDGIDTVNRIRSRFNIPVIYLTAFADDETMHRAKLTEPFAYLIKPYNEWELKFIIEIATYKHRLERNLSESERSYRTLAGNMPAIVYRTCVKGDIKVEFFNDMLLELTGYSPRELSVEGVCALGSLLVPEDKERLTAAIKQAIEKMASFQIDYRVTHKDGTTRYFHERGKPVSGDSDEALFVDGVIFDISERKRTEELTLKQRDLALALGAAADLDDALIICVRSAIEISGMDAGGIYLVDKETGDLDLAYAQGLSAAFIESASHYDANSPNARLVKMGKPLYREYADVVSELKNEVRARERLRVIAIIPVLHEKELIACLNLTSFTQDKISAAHRHAIETIAAEIGALIAHLRVKDDLRKERDRAQRYLDVAGVMMVAINADFKVELINRKGCEILGYSEEEILGKNWFRHFIPPKGAREVEKVFSLLMNGEEDLTGYYENTVLTKGGEQRLIAWRNTLLKDEKGVIAGTLSSGLDISERSKVAEELQKTKKLESLGLLAGGIAHDFNNILAAILINISLTRMYIDNKDRALERLKEASKAVDRAQNLTQQLLTFSRGGAPITKPAAISELLKETAEFTLSGSNVIAGFSLPDNLWHVVIDPGQISQVIQNLIMNAEQAMPDGGTVNIEAGNETVTKKTKLPVKEGKYVRLSIQDGGIGIPPDHLDKIFDPFFSTKQKGSGLGLSTAYSIIKNHNGLITVESELGKGTLFHIYLPASAKKAGKKDSDKFETFTGQGKILLMDDEKMLLDAAEQLLQKTGYDVVTARDGFEAVRRYKEARESGSPFDLVILDLVVPGGMGGKEAMRKLLEIDPEVKAVVSSGYSTDAIMADYGEYGFAAAVSKPYNPALLIEILQRLLEPVEKDAAGETKKKG